MNVVDPAARNSPSQTLQQRVAGQSVMVKTLELQHAGAHRSLPARVLGISPLREESRSWYSGALGELEVGRQLAKLGPAWRVLHAVPVGKRDSDIDHVVIGPGGVFTLNTKRHDGKAVWVGGRTVMVNGAKVSYIRNSEFEGQRAAKLLQGTVGFPVATRPVLVVSGAKQLTVKERPTDVAVLTSGQLLGWLRKQRPVLDPWRVDTIFIAANQSSTWQKTPNAAADCEPGLAIAFAGLQKQVNRAAAVRMLWRLLCFVVIIGALIYLGKP